MIDPEKMTGKELGGHLWQLIRRFEQLRALLKVGKRNLRRPLVRFIRTLGGATSLRRPQSLVKEPSERLEG